MSLDLRPTLPSVLKRAQQVLVARHAATSRDVAVLWQRLGESEEELARRVHRARDCLPDSRLLLLVCVTGAHPPREGVTVVDLPAKCFFVLHPSRHARFKVLKGGRGAAKSWSIARALVAMALERPISVLCCREIQHSIRASVHKVLRRQIESLGLSRYFNVDVRAITAYNGSTFDFEGLFANVDRIKSFEGAHICWIEEGASISAESWEILEPTLREPGSFFLVNYNPDSADSPTHKIFAVSPRPDAAVEHLTFQDNPHLTDPLRQAMEYMRSTDDDAYRHIWLGECRSHSDAQVFRGKFVVEEFEAQPEWSVFFGLDFGFSADPTAAVRAYVYDKVLYIEREVWGLRVDIDATPRLLDGLGEDARKQTIRADCARPESISYLKQHGYSGVVPASKWTGCIEDGIAFIRSFQKVVIHPRCEHAAEEFRLYSYKVDKLSGNVLPDVKDANNHLVDALRYSLEPMIQARGGGIMEFYKGLEAEATAPKPNLDPHHELQTVYVNGAKPPAEPLFVRALREKAIVTDV